MSCEGGLRCFTLASLDAAPLPHVGCGARCRWVDGLAALPGLLGPFAVAARRRTTQAPRRPAELDAGALESGLGLSLEEKRAGNAGGSVASVGFGQRSPRCVRQVRRSGSS